MHDTNSVRSVLEQFPYGIFILAAHTQEQGVSAIVATWVMQVSFTPPLVAVSLERDGTMLPEIMREGRFSINCVPADGIALAKSILKSGPAFARELADQLFATGSSDVPMLRGAAGVLDCQSRNVHEAGDHVLIIAEVVGGEATRLTEMLDLKRTGWRYRSRDTHHERKS